jgi:hypothetical protein
MSHINVYTKKDLLILNSMIDVLKYNVTPHIYPDVYLDVKNIDSIGIWRVCQSEEILKNPVARTIYKFIGFLTSYSSCIGDIPLTNLIYKESLENVPLYINKSKNLRLIAEWRLRIGK